MKHYEFVIVGGGLSGLLTALKLNELGKSALLIEQNPDVLMSGTYLSAFYTREKIPIKGLKQDPIQVEYRIDPAFQGDSIQASTAYSETVYQEMLPVSISEKKESGWILDFKSVKNAWSHINSDSFFNTKIKHIDLFEKKMYFDWHCIKYDYLFTTIPLLSFVHLYYHPSHHSLQAFRSKPIWIKSEPNKNLNPNMIITYFPDLPIYRSTEFNNIITWESITEQKGWKKIPHGKLYENSNTYLKRLLQYYGVHLIGKFANWQRHYLITDSIREIEDAIDIIEKEKGL